jgi:hypothetical protein
MVNISKQHAGTSHGMKKWGRECKKQRTKREKSPGITVWAKTDSGDRCPGRSGGKSARMSVLHENEGQNSGPERSCMDLSEAKK